MGPCHCYKNIFKETYNRNWFSFVELEKKWTVGSSLNTLFLKNHLLCLIKLAYEQFSLLFVSRLNTPFGKSCETPQGLQFAYRYQLGIAFFFKPRRVSKSIITLLIQLNQVLKSIFFPISKRNIYKSGANRKSNTRIKIPNNSIE